MLREGPGGRSCTIECDACVSPRPRDIVIAIARNPYDWLLSLFIDHWHAPSHGGGGEQVAFPSDDSSRESS